MLLTRGAIMVGNKTDLERQREVPVQVGKKLAKEINCKFIETSSGLDHNVDELLVGIVAQVKLNPQRICKLTEKQRLILCHQNNTKSSGHDINDQKNGRVVRKRQGAHASGPLNTMDLYSLKRSVKTKKGGKKRSTAKSSEATTSSKAGQSSDDRGLNEEDEDNKSTTSSSSSLSASPAHSIKSDSSNSASNQIREANQTNSAACSANSTPIKRGSHRHGSLDRSKEPKSNHTGKSRSSSAEEKPSTTPIKFSNRTKLFLTSFLKFKKGIRVKRRSSSSSDLFVI